MTVAAPDHGKGPTLERVRLEALSPGNEPSGVVRRLPFVGRRNDDERHVNWNSEGGVIGRRDDRRVAPSRSFASDLFREGFCRA